MLGAETAPVEGAAAQARARAAMAGAASDAGDHREAERLAHEAIELASDEMLGLRADVLVACAEILRRTGNEQGAQDATMEAARLYERKGNTVSQMQV